MKKPLGELHRINSKTVRDPLMREDKTCVVCGKPLPAPPDPFCSATCCREHYQVEFLR